MKIKLLILSLGLFLYSCGDNLPTGKVIQDPYIVVSIKESFKWKHMCQYNLSTGQDYMDFRDDISIIDSIGKFNVGDSVRLYTIKSK